MAFELKDAVPWGRNLEEYVSMFNLTEADLNKPIISIGDGPASFNCELKGKSNIVSIDPLYKYSSSEIKGRIKETRFEILEQMKINKDKFVWKRIKNISELEIIRMAAMNKFLKDFESGLRENRYVVHEMPNQLNFPDGYFNLGLSSHFLILYSQLGLDFHIASIVEMLRVAKEVRIFPIINLNGERTEMLEKIIKYFQHKFFVTVVKSDYEFQKGGNEMLIIKK